MRPQDQQLANRADGRKPMLPVAADAAATAARIDNPAAAATAELNVGRVIIGAQIA